MIRALVLALLLLATPAQAADDGWFFFVWDAETWKYSRSQKNYRTLVGCEKAQVYQVSVTESRGRYFALPCEPTSDATPPTPTSAPVQVIVR